MFIFYFVKSFKYSGHGGCYVVEEALQCHCQKRCEGECQNRQGEYSTRGGCFQTNCPL